MSPTSGPKPPAGEGEAGPSVLAAAVLEKVREQVELVDHLFDLVPPDRLDWRPAGSPAFTVDALLGHVLDCLAGFCAVLAALRPRELAHFQVLRELKVGRCGIREAKQKLAVYLAHIEEGFALITDDVLAKRQKTVFVATGEPVLTLFLGNLEHLVNHKFQLFFYLKLLSVPVGTEDLYRLRGGHEGP